MVAFIRLIKSQKVRKSTFCSPGMWEKILNLVGEFSQSRETTTCIDTPTGDKMVVASGNDGR